MYVAAGDVSDPIIISSSSSAARELAKIARIRNSSAAWLAGVRSGAIGYCSNVILISLYLQNHQITESSLHGLDVS
jgi:hypothetical protein